VAAPSGTVTFLFTDIEGSTRLWQQDEVAMRAALSRHDALLRGVIVEHGGVVFSTMGDGLAAAFSSASSAVAAALGVQQQLDAQVWPTATPIRVRMGLHTGEAELRDGDYFGTPVNQAARLMAIGHGGQVLVSAATAGLVGPVGLVDLGVHRLKDLPAPQRVFQLGDGRFPPLRSVDTVPGNLPTMLTELVGRAEDIADLVALVERERLVTLTGVGGVGKTSLALAVAAASTGSFPDGCWFAELASASTGDEVVRAVGAAMGTPASELGGLARFLSDRRTLVVLDNCEHVLSHAARLAEAVLGAGPEVAIIATSREPLGVRSEVVRGVRSLTVPQDDVVSATEAKAASAVSLFVARATSASEHFALDDENVETVVEICRQLDGIPLALELAAARVRGMGPAEIARRLGERFRLLTTGGRSLERHRTLQGAVAWSHDLLTDEEKVVFRRLAVFPATFDLAAAEAVAGGDGQLDVVDSLLRLVDRSLVVYDPAADRYRLLETLRQYATDRLADAGEPDDLRDRHASCYVALAAQCLPEGNGPTRDAFDRLRSELDNLRVVADWFGKAERWRELLTLARTVRAFLFNWTQGDGYRWYRDALDHLPELGDQERVDALGELAYLAMSTGHSTSELIGASIALADSAGVGHSPLAWHCRVATASNTGLPHMRSDAEMMLTVAEERGDPYYVVIALGQLAFVLALVGDIDHSAEIAEAALARARLVAHPDAFPVAVFCAAGSYLTSRVEPDFVGGMRILESNPVDMSGVSELSASWLDRMWGLAYLGLGDAERAVSHLVASLRSVDRNGRHGAFASGAHALAVALAEFGQPILAARLDGYTTAHPATQSIRAAGDAWLRARLAKARAASDGVLWAAATEAGARLDRRGFMRLLTEAEHAFDPGNRAEV